MGSMGSSQDPFRLKALEHEADNLNAKIERFRQMGNTELVRLHATLAYLFERGRERMEPSEDVTEDLLHVERELTQRLSQRLNQTVSVNGHARTLQDHPSKTNDGGSDE